MKILTIAIPAYNAESTLRQCVDSFVEYDGSDATELLSKIELIVVNDGSRDSTREIAEKYAAEKPGIVKVINKENGGHGSGINSAIKEASGKYFKVIDSDDWIVTENLPKVIEILEKTDADAVITGYKSINETTGGCQEYSSFCEWAGKIIGMNDFSAFFETMPACFQFHGLMYKTEFYKSLNIQMMEKVSYEDQQYAVMPFAKAEKILIIPEIFYVYRLGSTGQTVNFANQAKKANDMKMVIQNMIEYHKKMKEETGPEWSQARENFFIKRLSIAVVSYYAVVIIKNEDKNSGMKAATEFKNYLEMEEPEVASSTEKKYKTLVHASRLPGVVQTYNKLSDSNMYQKFKRKWNK